MKSNLSKFKTYKLSTEELKLITGKANACYRGCHLGCFQGYDESTREGRDSFNNCTDTCWDACGMSLAGVA